MNFGLQSELEKSLRTLSGGYRQKVGACIALIFDPKILVLDEPTAGLGAILTLIFVGIGFWMGFNFYEDRIKGLGFGLVLWLLLAILYDALILLIIYTLGDYPLEKTVLALSVLDPIDLARVALLMQFDILALMGYTGTVFERFFGSILGIAVALFFLGLWWSVPVWSGRRIFVRRDF